jgi:hypothetical protein
VGAARFTGAKVIAKDGAASLSVEAAFDTVRAVLCTSAKKSSGVHAVVVHGQLSSSEQPDHLSLMNSVISATKESWSDLTKVWARSEASSKAKRSAVEVIEKGGVRFLIGRATPKQFEQLVAPGVYIFPSHWEKGTIQNLGLKPLPKSFHLSHIVIHFLELELPDSSAAKAENADEKPVSNEVDLDKDSLAWRKAFVARYRCLSAEEVAEENGNTARNRSAIASRWASEKKVFSIRHESKTLYPKFQFKDGMPIPAISRVLAVLPVHLAGWDVAFFLTSPNSYLNHGKPVDLLKTNPDRVISLAEAFGNPADGF